MTQCPNCGVSIAEGAKFCSSCGLAFTQERAALPTPIRGITPLWGMIVVESDSNDTAARLAASLQGRYVIEKELGRGGMATVYLAKDVKHDRDVAIKVLLPELAASIGAERFEREIRLAAKLQHPHILGLYDSGDADGLLYYVMPFVKGESLRDRINREGMLSIEDAITITLEVAGALGHAHEQGIVHRDIKPENILLQGDHALVADFGIARAVSDAGAQKLTQTGMAVGTPVYMAPEQSVGETVGPTADLYSLGCVLYEMLAGEPPFTGKNAVQIMARHAMEQVPSIRIVRSAVPEEIEGAIFAVLGKVPADRPQTAAEFAALMGLPMGSTASMRVMRGATAARRVPTPTGGLMPIGRTAPVPVYVEAPPPVPAWKNPRVLVAAVVVIAAALGVWRFGSFNRRSAIAAGPEARRLAVLYFRDLSRDSSLGPLADGLTEGLIRALGTSSSMTVVSQAGVEKFRGSKAPRDSIAGALKVSFVVRGEVEPDGDKVTVSVFLDDKSGANLDKSTFTVGRTNPLMMRDTLTAKASDMVRHTLGSELKLKETRIESANAAAWLLLQRGLQAQKNGEARNAAGDAPGLEREFHAADSLFEAAENADSKWAEPATRRALLAYRRSRLAGSNGDLVRKWDSVGRGHADRAIATDPNNADAYEVRGNLRYFPLVMSLVLDPAARKTALMAAKADLEKATQLNSHQAGAYATLSHLYYQLPSMTPSDIYIAAQRAYEEDEFLVNANVVLSRLFNASYDLGQFDKAKQWCEVARNRFPRDVRAVRCQLYLLTMKSEKADPALAWRLADSAVAMVPPGAKASERLTEDMIVAAVLAKASKDQPALASLADSARHVAKRSEGSAEIDPTRDLAQRGAFVYTLLGDKDEAIRLLKQFLAANPDKAEGLKQDPGWQFKSLESDPRFRQAVGAQ